MTVWHGTDAEEAELEWALERNCSCDPDRPGCCGSHVWDLSQRQLDGLVVMRRIVARLWTEEMQGLEAQEEPWRKPT